MRVAYSALNRFENCNASFIYYRFFPRIKNTDAENVAEFGRMFHSAAEDNFDNDSIDFLDDKYKFEIQDLAQSVSNKPYFSLPALTEYLVEAEDSEYNLFGIIDRLAVDVESKKLYIIDFKTAVMPNVSKDLRQLIFYAMIIYESKATRERIVNDFKERLDIDVSFILNELSIDNIVLILDYVRTDVIEIHALNPYEYNRQRFLFMRILKEMKSKEDDFRLHQDIRRIPHTDGQCAFCFMKGMCSAYHMVVNCYYDDDFYKDIKEEWERIHKLPLNNGAIVEPYEHFGEGTLLEIIEAYVCDKYNVDLNAMRNGEVLLNSAGLISEYIERERILKLNEERLKALKKALLIRYENNDEEVKKYFIQVQSNKVIYPSEQVFENILPYAIKNAIKNVKFKDAVDITKLVENVKPILLKIAGKTINKSAVPDELQDKMERYKQVVSSAKYLKVKA
jgi:hypothetical protein